MACTGTAGAAAFIAAGHASRGDGRQQVEPTASTPRNHVQRLAVALRSTDAKKRGIALAVLGSLMPLPTADSVFSGLIDFEITGEDLCAVRNPDAVQHARHGTNPTTAPYNLQDSVLESVLASGLPEALAGRLKIGLATVASSGSRLGQQGEAESELHLTLTVVNGMVAAFAAAGTQAMYLGTGAMLDAGLVTLVVELASRVQRSEVAHAAIAAMGTLLWPWVVLASTVPEDDPLVEDEGGVRAPMLMQLRAAGMPGALASPWLLKHLPAASLALLGQWGALFTPEDSEQHSLRQDWARVNPDHMRLLVRVVLLVALRNPSGSDACSARHLLEDWLCCPLMGVLVRRHLGLAMTRLRARMPSASPGHDFSTRPASPPPAPAPDMTPLSLDSMEDEWADSMLVRSTSGCGAPTCHAVSACHGCGLALTCKCAASIAAQREHAPLCELLTSRVVPR